MEQAVSLLKQTELFRDLPEELIQQDVLPWGQLQEIPKGRFVIVPQQRVDHFGVILHGKLQVVHIYPDGNYGLMTTLRRGEILGADLVCTRSQIAPYHTIAVAQSRVLSFPVSLLTQQGLLAEEHRLAALNRLLNLIANENMKKEYRLAILSQRGLRERIITYLTMQAKRRRTNSFTISFSREEMADYLCVNRSALSHELSLMRDEGLIAFQKNRFTLYKPLEIEFS